MIRPPTCPGNRNRYKSVFLTNLGHVRSLKGHLAGPEPVNDNGTLYGIN